MIRCFNSCLIRKRQSVITPWPCPFYDLNTRNHATRPIPHLPTVFFAPPRLKGPHLTSVLSPGKDAQVCDPNNPSSRLRDWLLVPLASSQPTRPSRKITSGDGGRGRPTTTIVPDDPTATSHASHRRFPPHTVPTRIPNLTQRVFTAGSASVAAPVFSPCESKPAVVAAKEGHPHGVPIADAWVVMPLTAEEGSKLVSSLSAAVASPLESLFRGWDRQELRSYVVCSP